MRTIIAVLGAAGAAVGAVVAIVVHFTTRYAAPSSGWYSYTGSRGYVDYVLTGSLPPPVHPSWWPALPAAIGAGLAVGLLLGLLLGASGFRFAARG